MCSTPYDCHYSAYGGATPRGDRVHGRVGSAFRDAAAIQPGVLEEGEFFEGHIIEGEIIEGEIFEGEIIQGDVTESYIPMESEIIELPSTSEVFSEVSPNTVPDYPIVDPVNAGPAIDLPNTINDAVGDLITPSNPIPNSPNANIVPTTPELGSPVPLSSPSPIPLPGQTGNSLPNLDRVFDGLPPAHGEAFIEMQPAVIGQ